MKNHWNIIKWFAGLFSDVANGVFFCALPERWHWFRALQEMRNCPPLNISPFSTLLLCGHHAGYIRLRYSFSVLKSDIERVLTEWIFPDFALISRIEWRLLLCQSFLRKHIRWLPTNLKIVRFIHYYSKIIHYSLVEHSLAFTFWTSSPQLWLRTFVSSQVQVRKLVSVDISLSII